MCSLPPVVVESDQGERNLRLGCSVIELVSLATMAGRDRRGTKDLLRSSPAILIFALANYHEQNGRPPQSFKKLSDWAEVGLIRCFAGQQTAGWSDPDQLLIDEAKCNIAVRDCLRARSNRKLRKALSLFVRSHSPLEKATAKEWIRKIVGKRLTWKPQDSARKLPAIRAFDCANLKLWKHVDVESIFIFRESFESNSESFADRLQLEKLAAMQQLAYGASHEINNPLANISTRAQTLMGDEPDPERRFKLAVIYEQALRAHEMISDLMLFANPPEVKYVSTDIRLLMSKIQKEILPELSGGHDSSNQPGDGIRLQVLIGPEVGNIMVDPDHVCVALKALLRNSIESIRFGQNEGEINVRIFQQSTRRIGFEIADNGIGVSAEARRHLFDPYFSGREAGRGLGFGLSKALRIASMHGGELRFVEKSGPGAKFLMVLPENKKLISQPKKFDAA